MKEDNNSNKTEKAESTPYRPFDLPTNNLDEFQLRPRRAGASLENIPPSHKEYKSSIDDMAAKYGQYTHAVDPAQIPQEPQAKEAAPSSIPHVDDMYMDSLGYIRWKKNASRYSGHLPQDMIHQLRTILDLRRSEQAQKSGRIQAKAPSMPKSSYSSSIGMNPLTPGMPQPLSPEEKEIKRNNQFIHDVDYRVASTRIAGRFVTAQNIRDWIGDNLLEDILKKMVDQLKPEPVNETEEVVINYNDLADALARLDLIKIHGEFLPDKQVEEYKPLLKKYQDLILQHKRNNNV